MAGPAAGAAAGKALYRQRAANILPGSAPATLALTIPAVLIVGLAAARSTAAFPSSDGWNRPLPARY